jgi:regulator of replication initiation timing
MLTRVLIPTLIVLGAVVASAQISVDEAQRRLNQKLATRPAATQPISETDRLRQENRRLREENANLSREVEQLRDALANAAAGTPSTNPTTARSRADSGPGAQLIGRWQGGTLTAGNAFIIQFADDGSYAETWLTSTHRETGQWVMPSGDVVEMWTTPAADDQKRNRWRVTFAKDQITLAPLAADGTDIPGAKPFILQHPH